MKTETNKYSMTENEAIEILERDLQIMIQNKCLPDGIEATKVAIQSIKEVQQYRKIGTVKECQKAIERSVDYEDLAKRGKLSCAVGDTVYWCPSTEILPMKIEYFMIFSAETKIAIRYYGDNETLKSFSTVVLDKDIGKTIFPTKEKAEAALKEMGTDKEDEEPDLE